MLMYVYNKIEIERIIITTNNSVSDMFDGDGRQLNNICEPFGYASAGEGLAYRKMFI